MNAPGASHMMGMVDKVMPHMMDDGLKNNLRKAATEIKDSVNSGKTDPVTIEGKIKAMQDTMKQTTNYHSSAKHEPLISERGSGRMIKRILAFLLLGNMLLGSSVNVQAAPASGYSEFLKSLDTIAAGATMPVADENMIADRLPARPSGQATQVLAAARGMIGQPVVWGGASPAQGFDCSGLVQYVYRQAGINLPRTADLQFLVGRTVSPATLQPGDLVYFITYAPGASHVGIYIGGNKFIHTSYAKDVVAIADMNDSYFVQRYYGAKRVL